MTEQDHPRGRPDSTLSTESSVVPTDPELHRKRFEELSGAFRRGEFVRRNEDGSTTALVSYERYIDPLDRKDVSLLSEFRLRAAAAGLREAFSPLVLPTAATIESRQTEAITFGEVPHRPLTIVQLGYEKPAAVPSTPPRPAHRT